MRKNVFKKFILAIAITALVLTGAAPSFAMPSAKTFEDVPELKAKSAILIDASSQAILYEKNAHQKRDPASMTKILNLLTVIENVDLDEVYTIRNTPEIEGSIIELEKGETLTIKELAYGMMLESANDAAEVLAYAANDRIPDFCKVMNDTAKECGALDTKYVNPNGLNPNKVNNVTTAYDIAMVSSVAMRNETFREIVSTVKHTIPATNKSKARKLHNTNFCLWLTKKLAKKYDLKRGYYYEGCTGIKTGFSSTAGYCLCASAKRDGTELIAVIMGTPGEFDRFKDVKKLLNYGFRHFRTFTAQTCEEPVETIKVRGGEKARVDVGVERNLDVTLEKDYDESNIQTETIYTEKKLNAPVSKNQVVGEIIVRDDNGNELAKAELITLESTGQGGILSRYGIADSMLPIFYAVCGAIIVLLFIRIVFIGQRRRRRKAERKKATAEAEAQIEAVRAEAANATEEPAQTITEDEIKE